MSVFKKLFYSKERHNREAVERLLNTYVPNAMVIVVNREIPSVPAAFAYFLSMKVPQYVGAIAFAPEEYAPWSANLAKLSGNVFFELGSFLAWRLRSNLGEFIEELYDDRKIAESAKKLLTAFERQTFPTSERVEAFKSLAATREPDADTDARLIIEILRNSDATPDPPSLRQIHSVKEWLGGIHERAVQDARIDMGAAVKLVEKMRGEA